MGPIRVILLPGAVLPAQLAYGALLEALGPDVQAVAKDLELYAGDEPPPGWSLDTEIAGVLREADARGGIHSTSPDIPGRLGCLGVRRQTPAAPAEPGPAGTALGRNLGLEPDPR
ncbi:hypothetical protein PJ267_08825 [Arthrobacter sp. OVS8]|nr:hypothetical protein PJ267_08825 [Arthrobacter sp. OVS8]